MNTNNSRIINIGGTDNLSNNLTTNSLKITTATAAGQMSIAVGKTLTLTSGGLLVTGSQNYSINGDATAP